MRDIARQLTRGVAIYGAGDALLQVVNFGLLWVYVHYNLLTTADYGVLAVLTSLEAFAKVITRWGLDGAFMRFYLDCDEGVPRQRMASTIVWFMLAANAALIVPLLLGAPRFLPWSHADSHYITSFRLMVVNIFLLAFTFFPFYVMRLQNAAFTYSTFTFARSAGTLLLRIVYIIGLRTGVTGVYLADLTMTLILVPLLWPWIRPLLAFTFSKPELSRALRFGLPRLPHGLAQQYIESGPKLLLQQSLGLPAVGVYQNGSTLGVAIRMFASAFETAWGPFYYQTARQANAKDTFSKVTTYVIALLVLLVAGTTAVARDVVLLVLTPEYLAAVPVVPILALAAALQGVYVLTSIGLNLTSRTEFYPLITMTAIGVGFLLSLWLIPTYGLPGAALTVLLTYLTQATVAFACSQRLYPVALEWSRLAGIAAAGALGALAGLSWPPVPPFAGVLLRGSTAVVVFAALLWSAGFFRPTERAFLREMAAKLWRRPLIPNGTA